MKTQNIIHHLLGCLALVAGLIVGPAWAQATTPQTLTWTGTPNDILTLNVAHPLGATASSGLPVTLRVDTGPAAIENGTITVTAFGTVVVTAEQAGDATFAAARLTRSFNVLHVVLSPVGRYDTGGYGVQVVGNYAYVAGNAGLQVIDVSNPAKPVRVGNDTSGQAYGVQVVGSYAYLAGIDAGLQVIDVSNPASPVRVGGYDTSGQAYGVWVVENLAFVADGPAGLQVIDVSNPAKPVRVGGYNTSGQAFDVQVVGNYAYVADEAAGLQVIDVSNPANPVKVSGYDTSGQAWDVQVVGSYAYVADRGAGLQVIDVSSPASPVRVGEIVTGGDAYGVQVVGNYAYVADSSAGLQVIDVSNPAKPVRVGGDETFRTASDVQVVGNHVYVAGYEGGLQVFELRLGYLQTFTWTGTPNEILKLNTPHPLGATASSGLPVTFRVESGPAVLSEGTLTATGLGTVMISAEQAGDATYLPGRVTRRFNVRQALLTPVGGVDTSGPATGVQVVGNYAYVAAVGIWEEGKYVGGGLQVMDVSNPTKPVRVGGVVAGGYASGVQVVGNYAYLAAGDAGLLVIDVHDPVRPVRVGEVDAGYALNVVVVGNHAYVAGESAGLQVIDVSDPARPVRVGEVVTGEADTGDVVDIGGYDIGGPANAVQVVGNHAYVAAGLGLQVMDVSNPTKPVRVGAVRTGRARNLRVVGDHAYVTGDQTQEMQVIDVSDPAKPVRVGALSIGDWITLLDVAGNYAYVAAAWSNRLLTIDVSNPANPLQVGAVGTSGETRSEASAMQVVGDHAYVATGTGLRIFELRLGYPQTLDWTGTPNEILPLNVALPLGATASTGLPVTLRVESGPAVLADGGITATGLGNIWVTAEQSGDAMYLPATGIARVRKDAYDASGGYDAMYLPATGIARSFNMRQAGLTTVSRYNTGGYAKGVQVVGNYAYVAASSAGLQVIDVSNSASPVRVGGVDTSSPATGVHVVGNHAYVATGGIWDGQKSVGGGLQVIDVNNPASPLQVGGVVTGGHAYGVSVAGNYAYLAADLGLQVIDVSNPANPVRVGEADTIRDAYCVQAVGNYAYVGEQAGLQVIDVSNPARPVRVGGYDTSGQSYGVYGLQVVGNYAYVAGNGLQVIDVSNPANPVRVGGYNTSGYASAVQVVEHYAYVAAGPFGVQVIDVTNPARPVRVGGYDTSGQAYGVYGVQVVGNHAYVPDNEAGLQILELRLGYPQTFTWTGTPNEILALNVAHPLAATASSGLPMTLRVESGPAVLADGAITVTGVGTVMVTAAEQVGDATYLPARETRNFNMRRALLTPVGGYDTSGLAYGVQVVGNHAYVADTHAGLHVIDVSDPASPARVGGVDTSGSAWDVEVVGSYAYVAAFEAGLQVIDVSNPANPVKVGGYDTSGNAWDVQVVGSYAYVADRDAGLQVIDVSSPASPVRVGGVVTGNDARSVQVVGNYAYVAESYAGLQVIDVSNPARPARVGGVDTSGQGVQVVGNYAYVAGNGLQVIDVSNPASPVRVGGVFTGGEARGVQVAGNYAYVAASSAGLQVIDVSNPARPVRVGAYDISGQAYGVQVVGNYAYVAAGPFGLQILELRLGFPQTLELQLPAEIPFHSSPVFSAVTASSGLPLTLSVASGPATMVNNQLVLTGLGPVALRAEQAGNEDFLPVSAQWTVTVFREPLPPVAIDLTPTGVRFRFIGTPGRSYNVERAPAISGPWNTINTQTAPASGLLEYIDANPPGGAAFYRTSEP